MYGHDRNVMQEEYSFLGVSLVSLESGFKFFVTNILLNARSFCYLHFWTRQTFPAYLHLWMRKTFVACTLLDVHSFSGSHVQSSRDKRQPREYRVWPWTRDTGSLANSTRSIFLFIMFKQFLFSRKIFANWNLRSEEE